MKTLTIKFQYASGNDYLEIKTDSLTTARKTFKQRTKGQTSATGYYDNGKGKTTTIHS